MTRMFLPPLAPQKGLSLVELMVAMLLGLLLMGGVVGVVVNSKTSFMTVRESAMLQENGRYAMELLTREIRMAGYQECARGNAKLVNTVKIEANTWYLTWPGNTTTAGLGLQGLQGFEGVASPGTSSAWPVQYRGEVVANTDSIIIRRGDTTSYSVVGGAQPLDTFTVNKATDFKLGELVLAVAPSCTQVGIFQTTNANATTVVHKTTTGVVTPGNCLTALGSSTTGYNCRPTGNAPSTSFPVGTTLTRFNATAFYIRSLGAGQPNALFRRTWTPPGGTPADELVRGVEDMQIMYGLDTRDENGVAIDNSFVLGDGVADKFVYANDTAFTTWNSVINWNSVVSVRVVLQMRSISPVYTRDTDFEKCSDTNTVISDKYMRKCLSSTIAIRNQGL